MSDSDIKAPDLSGLRVLVTGGAGFIGSNLVHRLAGLGATVSIMDCLDPRSGGAMCNLDEVLEQVEFYCGDILDFDRLCEKIMGQDLVINCAASTSHSFSMREPWLDQDVNSRGMINILEAIRRFNPACRFIHLGTTTQLGKLHYQPADEKHPEFPTDIYSANKSVSEKYVLIYANAYNIDATVLRISNVFGPRASIHSAEFTFNNFFIGLALQDRAITIFGDGAQLRNVIYVDDVVNAIVHVSRAENLGGKALFVVGDDHYSVAEIAQATVEEIGSGQVTYVNWPKGRKNIDMGDAVISNDMIKGLLPWRPVTGLREGLQKTGEFYRARLDKYLR